MDNIRNEPSRVEEIVEESAPKDIVEGYDLSTAEKRYTDLKSVFDIFGQKYYRCPLKGVNENIRLYDKSRKEVKYELRLVTIKPYDISITTVFNENNRGQLRNKLNVMFSVVCPKYEHFINHSASQELFVTCDSKTEVDSLEATEVSIRHVVGTKNGKVLKTTPVPDV
jgi:hypothetical protein